MLAERGIPGGSSENSRKTELTPIAPDQVDAFLGGFCAATCVKLVCDIEGKCRTFSTPPVEDDIQLKPDIKKPLWPAVVSADLIDNYFGGVNLTEPKFSNGKHPEVAKPTEVTEATND